MSISKLPVWALYILIMTTLVLSLIILGRIWFPDIVDEELFWKIFWTYAVIVASSYVIAKIADLIKKIKTGDTEEI